MNIIFFQVQISCFHTIKKFIYIVNQLKIMLEIILKIIIIKINKIIIHHKKTYWIDSIKILYCKYTCAIVFFKDICAVVTLFLKW